jgi:hypothetical protein
MAVRRETPERLSFEEGIAVLEAARGDPRDYALLTLIRNGALKVMQVKNLNVDDYLAETQELVVSSARGGPNGRNRSVVPADSMAEAVEGWLRVRPAGTSPAMFSTRLMTRISDRHIRNLVRDYGRAAGLTKQVHAESLRLPFAIDDPYVRGIMGMPLARTSEPTTLEPYLPKADTDYIVNILGGSQIRSREHETLVNSFERWLAAKGLATARNAAVDLAVLVEGQAPVIIEAKYVNKWHVAVREAVSQLYEYRFFKVVNPAAELIFLASEPVPSYWARYLEHDRGIGVVWRDQGRFVANPLARRLLGVGQTEGTSPKEGGDLRM